MHLGVLPGSDGLNQPRIGKRSGILASRIKTPLFAGVHTPPYVRFVLPVQTIAASRGFVRIRKDDEFVVAQMIASHHGVLDFDMAVPQLFSRGGV